jgi:arginine/ornithine transport system permease protein
LLHGFGSALLDGTLATLKIAAASLAISMLFGFAGALSKLSGTKALRWLAQAYTTAIRGLPELVLLLFLFYGGQLIVNEAAQAAGLGYIDLDPFVAGIITIGFIYGAYLTETFRGAILAIPRGQMEAGTAFGMSAAQVFIRITLPQMVRLAIPGFTNTWLVMIKATALVSLIGMDDLMNRASLAATATREPFTFYVATGLIYLAITSVSILLLGALERKYSTGVRVLAA